MREAVLAVVLVCAGLAGCIGSEDTRPEADVNATEGSPATQAGPVTDAVHLEGCSEHAGFFPLAPSDAEQALPDGFEPRSSYPGPAPVPALEIFSRTCEGEDEPIREIIAVVAVEPPEGYRNASAARQMALVWGATTSPSHQERYDAWGLPFDASNISVDRGSTPIAGTWQTRATSGGDELRMATTVQASDDSGDGSSARLFGVEDGELTGTADIEWTGSGVEQGQATLPLAEPLPLTPDPEGIGLHILGFDETWRPADLTDREAS